MIDIAALKSSREKRTGTCAMTNRVAASNCGSNGKRDHVSQVESIVTVSGRSARPIETRAETADNVAPPTRQR